MNSNQVIAAAIDIQKTPTDKTTEVTTGATGNITPPEQQSIPKTNQVDEKDTDPNSFTTAQLKENLEALARKKAKLSEELQKVEESTVTFNSVVQKRFIEAILLQDESAVKSLLAMKADPNVVMTETLGNIPYNGPVLGHSAIYNPIILKLLLENNANPNAKADFLEPEMSMLLLAACMNHAEDGRIITNINIDAVNHLIDHKADVNEVDKNGQTILHKVSQWDQKYELVETLFKRGAIGQLDHDKRKPSHLLEDLGYHPERDKKAQEQMVGLLRMNRA